MKSVQALLPVFGLVAAAQAWSNGWNTTSTGTAPGTTVWTTETVATYTTYCPSATTVVTNGKTYTATASQTLTITDCPCKVTKPVTPTSAPTGVSPPVTNGTAIVTTVVTAYTTFCPAPTTVVQGNQTYTATSSQTLTITNCPCTVKYPATTTTVVTSILTTYCPAPTTITIGTSTYPVTTPGTTTIPVVTTSVGPASPPTPTAPVAPGTTAPGAPGSATNKPSAPASTTGPLQANSGAKAVSGMGALAAGFLAMLL